MDAFGKKDTRFPGSQKDFTSQQSVEVERNPLILFHSPTYLIYEAKKYLAVSTKKEQ